MVPTRWFEPRRLWRSVRLALASPRWRECWKVTRKVWNSDLLHIEARLEGEVRELVRFDRQVRSFRADVARGQVPVDGELAPLPKPFTEFNVAFDSLALGRGAVRASATSDPSLISSALWEAARHGWLCAWPRFCLTPSSWAWRGWKTVAQWLQPDSDADPGSQIAG